MKKHIMRITFFSILILAIVFCKTHQEPFAADLKVLATTIRGDISESPSLNNEEESDNPSEVYNVSDDYVTNTLNNENSNLEVSNYSSDNNSVSSSSVQANSEETLGIEGMYAPNNNPITSSNDFASNIKNSEVARDNDYSNQIIAPNSISDEKKSLSSRETASSISTKPSPEENIIPAATGAPHSPGGGTGQDPFQAPLDDYFALILLLIASSIMGVFGLKRIKTF